MSEIFEVQRYENGVKLVEFIAKNLSLSKKRAKALIDTKVVFVNNKRVWMAGHNLQSGDNVEVQRTVSKRLSSVKIAYQDEHYIVIDKPAGVLSNGKESVETVLQQQFSDLNIVAVHRLDRETSGCLIFATSEEAYDAIIPLFEEGKIVKIYQAIVLGKIKRNEGVIDKRLAGKTAVTRYRVLDSNHVATHLKLQLETGRTHQIRKHLNIIHHPLVGDKSYLTERLDSKLLREAPRQMLHARGIKFKHPYSGKYIDITVELPADYKSYLRKVELK